MRSSLETMFKSLGIPPSSYTSQESEQSYSWSGEIGCSEVSTLAESVIDDVIAAFGASLRLRIAPQEGFAALLDINDGIPAMPLSHSLTEIRVLCKSRKTLWVEVYIDKAKLKANLLPAFATNICNLVFYIFRERFLRLLSSSLPEVDNRIFQKPNGSTTIVLGDGNDLLVGPILNVVGVGHVTVGDLSCSPLDEQVHYQCDSFRQLAAENLSRLGYHFESITPLHLIVERHRGEPDAIDSLIAEQLFRCIILYTANRSAQTADKFEAYFAGADQTAKLVFPASLPNAHHDVHNDRLPQLHTLATWTLAKRDVDKLNIMQSIVARTIRVEDPEQAYQRLLSSIPLVLEQANSNYRTFIDNSIDKHFAQVDAAAAYLDSTIQHIGESIDAMTKSLTDSLIAAIGVVIVTILGALAKGEASGQIFQVSMVAYAVYLFFGQAIYKLGSIFDSYRMRIREAKEKRVIFEQQLSQSTVDKIYAPLKAREKQFHFWFRLTEVILIGLTIVILCVATHSDDLAALFLATATP